MAGVSRTVTAQQRLGFFVRCAKSLDPRERNTQSQVGICNNSDHVCIPQTLKWLNNWQAELQTYLKAKFGFLASLAAESELPIDTVASALGLALGAGVKAQLEDLVQVWRDTSAIENTALLLRLDQLPRDVVIENWYYDCSEYCCWVDVLTARQKRKISRTWEEHYGDGYEALARNDNEEIHSADHRAVADEVHSRFAFVINSLYGHLAGISVPASIIHLDFVQDVLTVQTGHLDRSRRIRAETLVSKVGTALMRWQLYGGAEEAILGSKTILRKFLEALNEAADCEYSDFLVWESDRGLLTPVVASDPSAKFTHLKEQPYGKGEGITGSAMLLNPESSVRLVGSNDYSKDPRGSVKQEDAWLQATGRRRPDLSDYWVVPVFLSDSVVPFGAFRVVNRARSRWVAGIPWPRYLLFELQDLALWFEAELLPLVRRIGVVEEPSVNQLDPAHVGAALRLTSQPYGIESIDRLLVETIISHLASVAFRKVEKNRLGCCIGIFKSDVIQHVVSALQPYQAVGEVKSSDFETLGPLYPRVNPTAGMFVFDITGNCSAVVNMVHQKFGTNSTETAMALTKLEDDYGGVIFLLERRRSCIRVVTRGKIVADYDMSEATGVWQLRMYDELIDQVVRERPARFSEERVRDIFRLAADLSYHRVGATLLLISTKEALHNTKVKLIGGDQRMNLHLSMLSRDTELIDLARIDGAIQIDAKGQIHRVGAIIRTTAEIEHADESALGRGSRHTSARDFSTLVPDALAIVISENGPISAYRGGKAVFERR